MFPVRCLGGDVHRRDDGRRRPGPAPGHRLLHRRRPAPRSRPRPARRAGCGTNRPPPAPSAIRRHDHRNPTPWTRPEMSTRRRIGSPAAAVTAGTPRTGRWSGRRAGSAGRARRSGGRARPPGRRPGAGTGSRRGRRRGRRTGRRARDEPRWATASRSVRGTARCRSAHLVAGQRAGRPVEAQPGLEQRLVGVDVPDARPRTAGP